MSFIIWKICKLCTRAGVSYTSIYLRQAYTYTVFRVRTVRGLGLTPPPQFTSTDAHFWVKICFKFQSMGKIPNISTFWSTPPHSLFRSILTQTVLCRGAVILWVRATLPWPLIGQLFAIDKVQRTCPISCATIISHLLKSSAAWRNLIRDEPASRWFPAAVAVNSFVS